MRSKLYACIGFIVVVACLTSLLVLLHPGGITWQFGPLTGAIVGATIILLSSTSRFRTTEDHEPWFAREQTSWLLIGCGTLLWGLGECVWRYYVLRGQNTFPSLADLGYASLPPFFFAGLLLQPSINSSYKKIFIVLDCLIVMGSLLSIAWYLLLGSLVQASTENLLAKFLGLYYPLTDIGLLSGVVFLLMRNQDRLYLTTARRSALVTLGAGLALFAVSDFIFNIQQNAGTYVEGKWIDLGWPLGLLTIGLAASLRRFLPRTSEEVVEQRFQRRAETTFGIAQLVIYLTLAILLCVLVLNTLSTDQAQRALRPILVFATITVITVVVTRQILTTIENQRLVKKQTEALEKLSTANQYIETQAQIIRQHNDELETGIAHLKSVQANLANGNLTARATLYNNELLPLAASLNLMADRLVRLGQADAYAMQLIHYIDELTATIEQHKQDVPLFLPTPNIPFPQMKRLIQALNRRTIGTFSPPSNSSNSTATTTNSSHPYRDFSPPSSGALSGQIPQYPEISPSFAPTNNFSIPDYALPSLPDLDQPPTHQPRFARTRLEPNSSLPPHPKSDRVQPSQGSSSDQAWQERDGTIHYKRRE